MKATLDKNKSHLKFVVCGLWFVVWFASITMGCVNVNDESSIVNSRVLSFSDSL